MAASAILFDLDGTIWDSIPWYATVLSNGEGARAAELEKQLRDGVSVIALAERRGLSKAALARVCRRRIGELQLFPDVRDTLNVLGTRAVPMGVVTSLAGDIATAMIEGTSLDHHFQTVAYPVNRGAGKAASMRRALSNMGIAASPEVFYVGDREDDAQCANACGVSFAWASYGYGEQPAGDPTILRKFDEVLEL